MPVGSGRTRSVHRRTELLWQNRPRINLRCSNSVGGMPRMKALKCVPGTHTIIHAHFLSLRVQCCDWRHPYPKEMGPCYCIMQVYYLCAMAGNEVPIHWLYTVFQYHKSKTAFMLPLEMLISSLEVNLSSKG